ncbi:amidohydrolase [Acrocarpospora phusangensis]|uniref:Amidohydrolase n=1 Tax=Acrocarpospora phusangensis TaxID=1070424 RepID=A0A919UKA9_9ACTN|nr:amidohydrolase family protein [Acrocarpospora phusangensis]GIH24811.1 amidohydrolase [Acrocarpospora phusangensis]
MIDSHHHLWDPARRTYGWMAGEALAPLRRPYGVDDLRRETSQAGITGTVLVQTVGDITETEEFLALAADSGGLIRGVVGWVDLTAPDVSEQLARLRTLPGGDLLVGIRHQVQDEADPEWLARPDVRRGLLAVAAAGLVYDLLILVPQLPVAREVVASLPDLRFVLDHAAKPPIASGELTPWSESVAALAELPNVSCKLSGLVTEASWTDWKPTDLAPYADHVLNSFGASRVMFGSDWPVCELAATYSQVTALAKSLTPTDHTQIFNSTAESVYALPPI